MRLICKLRTRIAKIVEVEVEVDPDDHIYKLVNLLNISKKCVFMFQGMIYDIWQEKTFREIGLMGDTKIFIYNQGITGGPTKICPQGCGRQIPEQYESCSALLKVEPDYFD